MRRMLGDWLPALRLAAVALGTSLLLALVFGLASRPASGDPHWSLKTTVAWVAWVWESIFGVDVIGRIRASGSVPFLSSTLDGSGSAHGWIGAMPLTLTTLTLIATAVAFRRAIAPDTGAVPALTLGLRAAVLTALPLLVVAWSVSLDATDVTALGAGRSSAWLTLDKSVSISLSAPDAFFVSLALLMALFAAIVLLQSGEMPGRWGSLQLIVATPVRAFARLAVGLVVAGLLFELVVWQVRWHTHWPGTGHRPSLTAHEWVNAFATAIAYAGNAGAMALGLGSFGQVGATASGSATAASFTQAGSSTQQHWIGWFAQPDHLAPGIWIALVIAPALLAAVLWPILRRYRHDARELLAHVGVWLVSLVVVVPVVAMASGLAAGGDGSAHATLGSVSLDGDAHGQVIAGLAPLVSTFAVFASAVLLSVLLVGIAGLSARRTSAAGTDRLSAPR